MTTPVPHVTLNSGHQIPQLGLGVFQVEADVAKRVVLDALEIGYRHIDGAWIYGNEEGVGEAIAESGIPRDELFITTKLWNTFQGRTTARDGLNESLEKLGLDYVDLYLIHWPAPKRDAYVYSWLALEEFVAEGLTRSIGVSNFMPEHLDKVLGAGSIVPAVNQVELHPAFQQKAQRAFHDAHGILTEAWGPLGQGKYDLAELPAISAAANETGKSLAQVAIRWLIQEGIIVFPKTTRRERLQENFDVFDFELTDAQMESIRAGDLDRRGATHPLDGNW
jgi:2,5-diketo-D-gluconate reductase A